MPAPSQAEFDAQARTVGLAWLSLVKENTALHRMGDAMLAAGTPDNSNLSRRGSVPVTADNSFTVDIARDLVRRGAVSRDEVHAVLPGLLN